MMLDYVKELLEMAAYFNRAGERELCDNCRDTANKILDHILYIEQMPGDKEKCR